jgi:hypothetical protein
MRRCIAITLSALLLAGGAVQTALAQAAQLTGVIFDNFNGASNQLSDPSNVLEVGNVIETISQITRPEIVAA